MAGYARLPLGEAREAEFLDRFTAGASALKPGPGAEESTQLGPLVTAAQFAHVERLVNTGAKEGAELPAGDNRTGEVGYFFEPTVFDGVKDDMTIAGRRSSAR